MIQVKPVLVEHAWCGFVFEGVMRNQALHLDGWHDMHLHSLLDDDPRPHPP